MAFRGDQDDDRWSEIPIELLDLIFKRLDNVLLDCIMFGAVCKSWRNTLLGNLVLPNPSVPLLLVPTSEDGDPSVRELLDPTTNRFYKIPPLHEAQNKIVVGSSGCWLITMDCSTPSSHEIELFNPMTRASIPLPPATKFDSFQCTLDWGFPLQYSIEKVMVFSTPNSGYIVMAIHGPKRHLAFCRIGDKKWTNFQDTDSFLHIHDVIYYKDRFYAVTHKAIVVACEIYPVPKMLEITRLPHRAIDMKYLVESSGKLLMVTRYIDHEDFKRTEEFTIDSLDVACNIWKEVTSMDDEIMFLGNSCSISVPASELRGCKPNRIYFVDDNNDAYYVGGCSDMGSYDFDDRKITSFYSPSVFLPWPMFWVTCSKPLDIV